MKQDAEAHEVQIAGIPFHLKSSHNKKTVDEILKIVEEQMDKEKQIAKESEKNSVRNSALLACLRMAEELFFLKKKTKEKLDGIEAHVLEHISQIQQVS